MKSSLDARDQILRALQPLVGLPMWTPVRALNMEMFSLGTLRTRVNRKGETVEVGDYSLHIQCPWRIYGPDGIIVGSEDRRAPADASIDEENFDPDAGDAMTRCEANILAWIARFPHAAIQVEQIDADSLGGFRLFLQDDFVLEAVPISSDRGEYSELWRLFRPGSDQHFVVKGSGIEGAGEPAA